MYVLNIILVCVCVSVIAGPPFETLIPPDMASLLSTKKRVVINVSGGSCD